MALPQLQRTWEKDELTTELRDALAIVDELDPPDDLRLQTFSIAAQLLTQRAQIASMPVDLGALGQLGRQLGT